MSRRWYILQTYTGYENKIERSIKALLESGDISSDVLTEVRVPVEELVDRAYMYINETLYRKTLNGFIEIKGTHYLTTKS